MSGYEKGILLVVYTGVNRGQNMVSCFGQQFLFYSKIIVYTISRIVPKSMHREQLKTRFPIPRKYAILACEVIQLPHNQCVGK